MTKLFSANVIIGSDTNQHILESICIKRLPVHLLTSDTHFIKGLILKCGNGVLATGEKKWDKLRAKALIPKITVFYLSYLGEVSQDPALPI